MSEISKQADEVADFVRVRWGTKNAKPDFGIILGTGSGNIADQIDAECQIPYADIGHFPASTAIGHKGTLVCGYLAGEAVVAMQGRFHLYEGYPVDKATLPILVMKRLGVKVLFVSNAAGGLNPMMKSGEIMLIDSHIDFMYRSTPTMFVGETLGRPHKPGDFYDRELMLASEKHARNAGFALHRGVYAALLGPNYETRAEYRFLRKIGADVVGMSTVPEVCVAGTCGMRVLAMSVVTNIANPDSLEPTSGEEVVAAAETASPHLTQIVLNAITTVRGRACHEKI